MIRIIPQPNELIEKTGVCMAPENLHCIKDSTVKNAEGYRLDVTADGVYLYASDERGFFYGRKTLEQLKIQYGGSIPCLTVKDYPVFGYRGFMLDCARHLIDFDEIKRMIDIAAMLKLNKLHWHLSDDQGFRIELDSFPELTEKGSIRKGDDFGSMCRSDKPYSGYYTKAQIREIIEYCRERYIDVIPEIDMPGHSSAMLHVFPELSCRKEPVEVKMRQGIYKDNFCLGREATFEFITKLLDELCGLFPYPVFHIGGDEAPDDYRKDCPDCQKAIKENGLQSSAELQCVFANRVKEYLKTKGKKAVVWNDILKGSRLDKDITVQRWMDPKNGAIRAANEGQKIIVSDFKPYYFDYPYGMYPLREVYNFNPTGNKVFTDKGRRNVIGTETPIWTEFIDNPQRLEYLCLPRWFAFAENAWTPQKNKDYKQFKSAAENLAENMKKSGISYAPSKDWDMPAPERLWDVIKFFSAFLSKK